MPNGTVKFFNAAKGFGFITPDDGAKDIFVPATSIAAAATPLKAGQRVSFTAMPDAKGPKAVDLKIIAQPPQSPPPPNKTDAPARTVKPHRLAVYLDPDSDAAEEVLAELSRAGHEPVVVDYMATPPSKEELKRLSLMLRDRDQSLVRRYEPLFRELRLDDRFISDSEYWEAIYEHPALINGPLVVTAEKAGLCRSRADVKAFLSAPEPGGAGAPARRKELSPGLLRLISGGVGPLLAEAPAEKPQAKAPVENPPAKAEAPAAKKVVAVVKPKAAKKVVAKPASAAKAKPAAKAAPKPAAHKSAKKAAVKSKKR